MDTKHTEDDELICFTKQEINILRSLIEYEYDIDVEAAGEMSDEALEAFKAKLGLY